MRQKVIWVSFSLWMDFAQMIGAWDDTVSSAVCCSTAEKQASFKCNHELIALFF
jgi:hypothetical protein